MSKLVCVGTYLYKYIIYMLQVCESTNFVSTKCDNKQFFFHCSFDFFRNTSNVQIKCIYKYMIVPMYAVESFYLCELCFPEISILYNVSILPTDFICCQFCYFASKTYNIYYLGIQEKKKSQYKKKVFRYINHCEKIKHF